MHPTFADKVIAFNRNLRYSGSLPEGFRVLNPFFDHPKTVEVMQAFYKKYYDDWQPRRFIIGINPGRHGAGITGIPFTDTKRLESICGIPMPSAHTHEVSSVFIYDMIAAYGGAELFYRHFYINSPFPLAIIRQNREGVWLNANYYDEKELFEMVSEFMIASLKQHIALGLDCSQVYVLGKKNADFIRKLNKKTTLFDQIAVLEHPRYIQQYRSKERESYIKKYLQVLQRK